MEKRYWILVQDYGYSEIGLVGLTDCEDTARKFESKNNYENRAIETPLCSLDSIPKDGTFLS